MIVENLETGAYVEACPLCGDNAFMHTSDAGETRRNTRFWVKCDALDCRCTTIAFDSAAGALAAWNRRVRI